MIPAEKIYLTIIRDVYEDKGIFEELPIESMSMSAPLVCLQIKRD